VGDVREERRLGAIDFGQGIGTLARPLILIGARDGGGDLRGQQFDEASVTGIERAMRAEGRDEIADRLAAFRSGDGRDQCLAGR
jgi:hypothetical protein